LMRNIPQCRIFRMSSRRCEAGHLPELWRRSSASIPKNDCMEVHRGHELVAVRDSKDSTESPLRFEPGAWEVFLDRLRDGN
jgi:Domain of unknown function (DUF397)